MAETKRLLIYGYGNPGREDDGLGAAFINRMEAALNASPNPAISLDCNYQLNIEDAERISSFDTVLFVDASQEEDVNDFKISRVDPSNARIEFTMHAVSVPFVLDLCQRMFGKTPVTYLLHIRGYGWGFKEELTLKAKNNLEEAFNFVSFNLQKIFDRQL